MSIQKANKNEVRKEIAALIDRIKEQSDRIGMQREIPQSELDVILHRIEELHRRTVVWSYLNTLPEETEHEQAWVDNFISEKEESAVDVPPILNEPVVVPVNTEEVKAVVSEIRTAETKPVVQPEVINEPASTTKPEEPETPVAPEQQIAKPATLKDVRGFIGFNEKIMYLRQLFGGDAAAYDESLNQINAMNSFAEAEAFLSVLAGEYKWNKDHEAVTIFHLTVKRRFS